MPLPAVILKKGKEIPLRGGHPWVFSGAVEKEAVGAVPGDLTEVFGSEGDFLGTGTWHGNNSIKVRMLSEKRIEKFSENFFEERFRKLLREKRALLPGNTTGYRLVHSDADRLPGLIVDIFGSIAVFQLSAAGFEDVSDMIVSALLKILPLKSVIERSDTESRRKDDLPLKVPEVRYGEAIDKAVFFENGLKMIAQCLTGQKTGFFLDQRDARGYLKRAAGNKNVLDLFSNSGGFSLSAAAGNASSVTAVDVSSKALALLHEMLRMNHLHFLGGRSKTVNQDVFEFLETVKPGAFDIIVCDPPAFAKNRESAGHAEKAYIRLNRKCFEKLLPGSLLITSSCSGAVSADRFSSILRIAAGQSKKEVKILRFMTQPADHTLKIAFPEGLYLKTFVLQVV